MSSSSVPKKKGWYSRKYVPHFDDFELIQSVTIRLFDSLPQSVLEQAKPLIASAPQNDQERVRRVQIEKWIDRGYGSCFLRNEQIAQLVQDALMFFDQVRYDLHAWVIMPNHLHILFSLYKQHSLSSVMQSFKSYTGRQANLILQRNGEFWFREYYDRYVRNEIHFNSVADYIDNNPVKAGLCSKPQDWRFGSAGFARWSQFARPPSDFNIYMPSCHKYQA